MWVMIMLVLLLFLSSTTSSTPPSSGCNHACGARTVSYPFGFSAACPIQLSCSGNEGVNIGGFPLRNITSDALIVDVPPVCNRSIMPAVHSLSGSNYAMTWKNVLLARNCMVPSNRCVIPSDMLTNLFDVGACGATADNITCLSTGNATGYINATVIEAADCRFMFTSVSYEYGDTPYLPSIVFRTVELGWWLDGGCRCSAGARCTPVRTPAGGRGFRCGCPDGYEGDGFADGRSCRKATTPMCDPSKCLSGTSRRLSRFGFLIGGIVAGATLMAAIALACYLIRKRSTRTKIRKGAKRLLSQASSTVLLYTNKEVERATNGFSDDHKLGTGAYGTVYAGKLNNDKLVAIKRIRHRGSIQPVMNEIKLLSSVNHPNLVRLLGCCIEGGEQILIYEFMPNGTLSQHLQRERGPGRGLPWTIRLTIAVETAKAIAYLHSAIHPPVYHRDIKSSNILLDYSYNSKVADFGLSRVGIAVGESSSLSPSSHISTAPQGTPGYLDPQYHQNCQLSDKSDVYSFGVVLAEMITGLKAVDYARGQGEVNLAVLATDRIRKGRIDEIIDPYLELKRGDAWTLSAIHKAAELMFRCLAFDRDARPSMVDVADELEAIRVSGWATPDDVFMSPGSSLCSADSGGSNRGKSRTESNSKRLVMGDEKSRTESNSKRLVMGDEKVDQSPVSVQDMWVVSEQTSLSSNSLLALG